MTDGGSQGTIWRKLGETWPQRIGAVCEIAGAAIIFAVSLVSIEELSLHVSGRLHPIELIWGLTAWSSFATLRRWLPELWPDIVRVFGFTYLSSPPPPSRRWRMFCCRLEAALLLILLAMGSWGLASEKGPPPVGCFLLAAFLGWHIWLLWPRRQ
jgi:hypothetical protein